VGRNAWRPLLWIGLAIAPACCAENLCPLLAAAQGYALPAAPEAYTFLDSIGKLLGTPTRLRLFPSSSPLVAKRAAAQMCGAAANERWIFYDQSYLNALSANARNFVLAHEAAHHLSGDTLLADEWNKEQELAADYSAAVWLTRLGVGREALLQAFDTLGFAVESVGGYPTRAERRAKVIEGTGENTNTNPGAIVSGRQAGETRVNPKDNLTYVWIPAGKFMMGCSPGEYYCDKGEKPAHEVTIAQGFWIGQTEVTQEAYQKVMGKNPTRLKGAKLPVETEWDEAQNFCGSVGMRLPTEAEWEYAARAGGGQSLYMDIAAMAWYVDNSAGFRTHEVMMLAPNAWGLYDMLGNVEEWTSGRFSNGDHVARGGSSLASAESLSVSHPSTGLLTYVGIRCAGDLP